MRDILYERNIQICKCGYEYKARVSRKNKYINLFGLLKMREEKKWLICTLIFLVKYVELILMNKKYKKHYVLI